LGGVLSGGLMGADGGMLETFMERILLRLSRNSDEAVRMLYESDP
jgi:aspartyl aminopeptidase